MDGYTGDETYEEYIYRQLLLLQFNECLVCGWNEAMDVLHTNYGCENVCKDNENSETNLS